MDDPLKGNGNRFAKTKAQEIVDYDDVLAFMEKLSGLHREDMRATIGLLREALLFYMGQGLSVRTPIGVFSTGIRVTAKDKARNRISAESIVMHLRADKKFRSQLRETCEIEIEPTEGLAIPQIHRVRNLERPGAELTGVPGDVLEIRGRKLGFDTEKNDLGVFFVPERGPASRATFYSRAGSWVVNCRVPETLGGHYHLEVRTRPTGVSLRAGRYTRAFLVDGH